MAVLVKISYKNQTDHFASVMQTVISYCLRPEKTASDETVFTTAGQNCSPDSCFEQFMATKASWKNTGGVCFKHYVQSFRFDEDITPEKANEIAMEFAAKAWEGYEVMIATHVDRAHIHSHFILNTVHPDTGKKIREDKQNIMRLRQISDEICLAHGLSVLSPYEKNQKSKTMGTREYRSAYKGDSWKMRLRSAIKNAMEQSYTREDFIAGMEAQGYGVRWEDGRKNITYTCNREPKFKDGKYRKCNDDKLNDDKYLKGNMEYEFEIRKEIIRGRAYGASEYGTDTAEDGNDIRRRMDGAQTDAHENGSSADGYGTGAFRDEQDGEAFDTGAEGADRREYPHLEGEVRRTGWESERESCFSHRSSQINGRFSMGATPRGNGTANGIRFASVGLHGLASAMSIIDDDKNKTPEEIEAEERARLSAENAGALIGLAAEVAMEILSKDSDTPEEEPTEEIQEFRMEM